MLTTNEQSKYPDGYIPMKSLMSFMFHKTLADRGLALRAEKNINKDDLLMCDMTTFVDPKLGDTMWTPDLEVAIVIVKLGDDKLIRKPEHIYGYCEAIESIIEGFNFTNYRQIDELAGVKRNIEALRKTYTTLFPGSIQPGAHRSVSSVCIDCNHPMGSHYGHDGPDGPADCDKRDSRTGNCPGHCEECGD